MQIFLWFFNLKRNLKKKNRAWDI